MSDRDDTPYTEPMSPVEQWGAEIVLAGWGGGPGLHFTESMDGVCGDVWSETDEGLRLEITVSDRETVARISAEGRGDTYRLLEDPGDTPSPPEAWVMLTAETVQGLRLENGTAQRAETMRHLAGIARDAATKSLLAEADLDLRTTLGMAREELEEIEHLSPTRVEAVLAYWRATPLGTMLQKGEGFIWGKRIDLLEIGPYQVVVYHPWRVDCWPREHDAFNFAYAPFVRYQSTSSLSFSTLRGALIGAIAWDCGRMTAAPHILRMLGVGEGEDA